MRLLILLALWASSAPAAQYSAHRDGDVIRLEDSGSATVVSIVPSVNNIAFEMKVHGKNALAFPFASLEDFKAHPTLTGIPFLGPWANRLDETAFYANGKKYIFNMGLGNVRGAHPIHGLVSATPLWQVIEVRADKNSAWATSRLDFYRVPDWMGQFPFAHTVEMTYRLQKGILQVQTRLQNLSTDPMPVAIGFHPFFHLTDSKRDDWKISVGARTQWVLSADNIPTGETRPIEKFFPNPTDVSLKDYNLDHVFGDLIRDDEGRAVMSLRGVKERIDVLFGPKYRAAVVWAPSQATLQKMPAFRDPNFMCFEPMAGITDALNLAQKGIYKELQSIPPGQSWDESFWVHPVNF